MSLEGARRLVGALAAAGHSAFLVGGCVRDMLRGEDPNDFDIASSAAPDQVKRALGFCRFADTGLRHGTVTAILDGEGYQITTFRTEAEYSDHRRPDRVIFVQSIQQDLARRDFTINAMAMTASGGIIDPFGGRRDLAKGLIRCVGDPRARFTEDPLRIMRAVRFCSSFGFMLEPDTAKAAVELAPLLDGVSRERVGCELSEVIAGKNVLRALLDFHAVIFRIIPELEPLYRFDQKNPWHIYCAYEHTARVVAACRADTVLRLAALLHDIAKPACFTLSPEGRGRFYGHAEAGARMAEGILRRLRYPSAVIKLAATLVKYHSADIKPEKTTVRRWISALGADEFLMLAELKAADDSAKNPVRAEPSLADDRRLLAIAREVIAREGRLDLASLAIKGEDIIALGVPQGREVGRLLRLLLNEVVSGKVQNEKGSLARRARELIGR